MSLDDIISEVSKSTGYSVSHVNKVYKAYWKAVRMHIKALPLKEELTDEAFMKLQPNINIPSIGKLYVTLDRYHRMKKHNKILLEKKQLKNKQDVTY